MKKLYGQVGYTVEVTDEEFEKLAEDYRHSLHYLKDLIRKMEMLKEYGIEPLNNNKKYDELFNCITNFTPTDEFEKTLSKLFSKDGKIKGNCIFNGTSVKSFHFANIDFEIK